MDRYIGYYPYDFTVVILISLFELNFISIVLGSFARTCLSITCLFCNMYCRLSRESLLYKSIFKSKADIQIVDIAIYYQSIVSSVEMSFPMNVCLSLFLSLVILTGCQMHCWFFFFRRLL